MHFLQLLHLCWDHLVGRWRETKAPPRCPLSKPAPRRPAPRAETPQVPGSSKATGTEAQLPRAPSEHRPGKLCRIRPLERLSARLSFLHGDWLSPKVVAGAFTQPPENLGVSESFYLHILVKLAIGSWEGLFLRQTARLRIGRRWHPLRRLH